MSTFIQIQSHTSKKLSFHLRLRSTETIIINKPITLSKWIGKSNQVSVLEMDTDGFTIFLLLVIFTNLLILPKLTYFAIFILMLGIDHGIVIAALFFIT